MLSSRALTGEVGLSTGIVFPVQVSAAHQQGSSPSAAVSQRSPSQNLPAAQRMTPHSLDKDQHQPGTADVPQVTAEPFSKPSEDSLHDLDANAQWLEVLSSCPARSPAATRIESSPDPSDVLLTATAATDPSAASAEAAYCPSDMGIPTHSQLSGITVYSSQQPFILGKAQLQKSSLHKLTQRPETLLSSMPSEADSTSSDFDIQADQRSRLGGRLPARRTITWQQQDSSEESDQMTFAEAAGIRRRPDELTWPAYGALQEGRPVRLLDRNSPVPPRSKRRSRPLRGSSRESRQRREVHFLEDSAMDLAGFKKPENVRMKARTGPQPDISSMAEAGGNTPSLDDESPFTLERLLTAWQKGANENEDMLGAEAQLASSMSSAACQSQLSAPAAAANAHGLPDLTMSASTGNAADSATGTESANQSHAQAGPSTLNSDPILGDFWDMWQVAAKQSADQRQAPAAPAIDIPNAGKQQHHKHASRAGQAGHGMASERLHRRQRQKTHAAYTPERLRKALAAAAAAALSSSPADEAAQDPLEDLLALYPGLDPVVADLILQVLSRS